MNDLEQFVALENIRKSALSFIQNMVKCNRSSILEVDFEIRAHRPFLYSLAVKANENDFNGMFAVLFLMKDDLEKITRENTSYASPRFFKSFGEMLDWCPFKECDEYRELERFYCDLESAVYCVKLNRPKKSGGFCFCKTKDESER